MYLGAENEYNSFLYQKDIIPIDKRIKTVEPKTTSKDKGGSLKPYVLLGINNRSESINESIRNASRINFAWLHNGGKIYTDNENIEYATPECASVKELVLAEKAGEKILSKFFSFYDENNFYLLKRTSSAIFKLDKTAGSHENYSVTRELFKKLISISIGKFNYIEQIVLITHLASRIIYTGAGHITQDNTGHKSLTFSLSPRAYFIETEVNIDTVEERALINSRDEPLVFDEKKSPARLHLICGDMNRSDFSLYLKYGTTALILAYLEIAQKTDIRELMLKIRIINPVIFMKNLSFVGRKFFSNDSKDDFNKAIIIQKHLLQSVKDYENEIAVLAPEAKTIIELWENVLADFCDNNHPGEKYGKKLDWLIKKNFIEETIGGEINELSSMHNPITIKKILSRDLSYHRVNKPNADFYKHLLEKNLAERLYSDIDIDFHATNPPKGRATIRTEIAKYALKKKNKPHEIALKWAGLHLFRRVYTGKKIHKFISFDDDNILELKKEINNFVKLKPRR